MYSNLFSPESIEELTAALQTQFLPAIWETFYVTLLSTAFAIVIGLPLNMDGTEGERAAKSRKLAKTVEIWSGLPVRMWDERQTTCAAADLLDESGTFGTKRKEILDSVSATVILDDYLAWRKEHPGEM